MSLNIELAEHHMKDAIQRVIQAHRDESFIKGYEFAVREIEKYQEQTKENEEFAIPGSVETLEVLLEHLAVVF